MTASLAAATRLTGQQAVDAVSLGSVQRVVLADGRCVVVKRGTDAEAASLRWLADAGAVPVVPVLGQDRDWLVLGWIEPGRPGSAAAVELGRGLAALHASGAAAFGQAPPGGPRDAWIGMAAMVNEPAPSWPAWYGEHRILPYVRRCVAAGTFSTADAAVFDRVIDRLPELAGPAEPPARLHGDLWSGNVVWSAGPAVLIDPAAHGGHRETDLAMLALFGCPELARVLAGYQEVAPLADGWAERVALHQLFPLLVHAELFGGGYPGRAVEAARNAGGYR
ncbi:MAG TPA: fructosamine kinase family protein [Pseudonocardiaceae bacterium]|jgi:fructosamine-3-kinase|nr:fructosamine kinase family protein [Pseudonocardiaceae bacterium]